MAETNWVPWIIGGVVVVLVILLIVFLTRKPAGISDAEYVSLMKSCAASDSNLQSCCKKGGKLFDIVGSRSNVTMTDSQRECACKATLCDTSSMISGIVNPPSCSSINSNLGQAMKDCGISY